MIRPWPRAALAAATIALVLSSTATRAADSLRVARPLAVRTPMGAPPTPRRVTGLPPLTEPMRIPPSLVEAPPFDEDAQAMARLRASRDPAVVAIVRLLDDRERRLAELRELRATTRDPMAILQLQRRVERVKLDCERGMLVAQLDRARARGLSEAEQTVFQRRIDQLDRRVAFLQARQAARGGR